jgi:hypothetical protein
MAAMSAAMFSVLASTSSITSPTAAGRGMTRQMSAARPWPVIQPMRARHLDAHHQRRGERQRPQQAGAELRAPACE